ncbi:MAG: hypothetical protein IPM64_07680 [Phycisphaerales bacterium]|nr:hypothetical protein [Phycisphaerales bacterium]
MTRLNGSVCLLVAFAGVGLMGYTVLAQTAAASRHRNTAEDGRKIAAQLDRHKMTLAKAVAAAEDHSKGRAISVISQVGKDDQAAVHVWCVTGEAAGPPKIMKCFVDLASGKVAGMTEVHEFPTMHEGAELGHKGGHERPDAAAAKTITDQTVDAACGVCIYKMPGMSGCPLAIKIDGKAYLVEGAKWPNHDYCDRDCKAVVSGRIEGGKFIATKFAAKP